MIFSPEAVANKSRHLDSINHFPDLVGEVVSAHLDRPFVLKPLDRFWEPGGGASLFRISTGEGDYFLKVKHRSVFVESRLESEPEFNFVPSLENEAHFLALLTCEQVPQIIFFAEREEFTFLALEWLEPFSRVAASKGHETLIKAWENIEKFVQRLFKCGITHTDLHEGNLCFRGDEIVICDFEEARYLRQDLPYSESLDVCGKNRYGNVGFFPAQTGKGRPGLTCLDRLQEVFFDLIRERLRSFLADCRFDQSCPFNKDELQLADTRIYQSINLAGLHIPGQRPPNDRRKNVLSYFLLRMRLEIGRPLHYVDFGSNLGAFCFHAAKEKFVEQALGLEAYQPYVEAAGMLNFLDHSGKVGFQSFICGESNLAAAGLRGGEVCTLLSIYHHIARREEFLLELGQLRPQILIAEFATQERYYPERGNVKAEIEYVRQKLGYKNAEILLFSQDYRRPLVLFADRGLTLVDRFFMKLANTRHFQAIFGPWRSLAFMAKFGKSATRNEE